MSSLYRRPLPEGLIAFGAPEGRQLFAEALALGGMERWFPLAEHFHTQSEPAFCALGSLVVVLNALAIDPGRTWRGPWRWYSEELLDCCEPLEQVRERGMSLPSFVCLARCNGATATLKRPGEATVDDLRADLAGSRHIIASFSRASLGQTGDGHYSPLGGWHPTRDLVLVLDVARFKYPPFWVPTQRLFDAMYPVDPDTSKPRGWVLLDRANTPRSLHARVNCVVPAWRSAVAALPALLEQVQAEPDAEQAARALVRRMPEVLLELVQVEPPVAELVRQTRLYQVLRQDRPDPTSVTLLLLAAPADRWPAVATFWEDVPGPVRLEAEALGAQVDALR